MGDRVVLRDKPYGKGFLQGRGSSVAEEKEGERGRR